MHLPVTECLAGKYLFAVIPVFFSAGIQLFGCLGAWIHTVGALRPLKACGKDGHLSIVNRN